MTGKYQRSLHPKMEQPRSNKRYIAANFNIRFGALPIFELSVDGVNWVGPYEVGSSGTIILQNGINTVKVRAYHEDLPDTCAYDQKVVFRLSKP